MCAISLYYGDNKAVDIVSKMNIDQIDRGRDATGIAYLEDGELKVVKKSRPATEFIEKWKPNTLATVCIGHVRAASTNRANKDLDREAHPFVSEDGSFALVHNGTVHGHTEYRNMLSLLNHKFTSGVDSEVYVHTLEELLKSYSRRDAMFQLFRNFNHGNILVMFKDGEIYGIPNNTSFNLAVLGKNVVVASEKSAIYVASKSLNYTDDYTIYSSPTDTLNQLVRFVRDKDDRVQVNMFGDWKTLEVKEGFAPEKTIMCDVCKKSAPCERATKLMKSGYTRKYDRCYDCFKANKEVPDVVNYNGYARNTQTSKINNKRRISNKDAEYDGSTPPKHKCKSCSAILPLWTYMTFCPECETLFCHTCYSNPKVHLCKFVQDNTKKKQGGSLMDSFFRNNKNN